VAKKLSRHAPWSVLWIDTVYITEVIVKLQRYEALSVGIDSSGIRNNTTAMMAENLAPERDTPPCKQAKYLSCALQI